MARWNILLPKYFILLANQNHHWNGIDKFGFITKLLLIYLFIYLINKIVKMEMGGFDF